MLVVRRVTNNSSNDRKEGMVRLNIRERFLKVSRQLDHVSKGDTGKLLTRDFLDYVG